MTKKIQNILCYDDSMTCDFFLGSLDFKAMLISRYEEMIRWVGRLQSLLKGNANIIECGLYGKATNIEYQDITGGSGKTGLLPCFCS